MSGTVAGRSAALIGGRAVSDALQLVLYVFVVRSFSEAEIGDYSFAFAVALILGLVVGMGTRSLVTREVRNTPELGAIYPVNLLFLHTALTILAGCVLLSWSMLAGLSTQVTALAMLASLTTSLMASGYSAIGIVDASGAVQRGAVGEVAAKVVSVLAGFVFLIAGFSITAIVASQVLGAFVYLILAYRWVRVAYGPITHALHWPLIARTLRMAIPFAAAALLYALYARIDIIMLHRMIGPESTGQYGVAFRFVETSLVVASMVGFAMFPELAEKEATGSRRQLLFSNAVRWLALLGGSMTLALVVAGDQLTTLVFGSNYDTAGQLLMPMALLITIGYIKEPLWRLLIAQDREYLQLGIQGLAVCLNVGLNLLLIRRFGAFGAVAASLISESLMLAGFAAVVVRQGWVRWRSVGSWTLVMAAAAAVGFVLRTQTWPIAAAAVAVSALLGGFLLTRLVAIGEIRQVMSRPRRGGAADV